jgi:hypothetical protein
MIPLIPPPRWLDSEGNPTTDLAQVHFIVIGNLRTQKGGKPQRLINGDWIDVVPNTLPPPPE